MTAPDAFVQVDGTTRLLAIIGDPVAQVRSPQLFNDAFRRRGANAVLVPGHVGADDLPAVLDGFRALRNLAGVVVTVPHKVAVARLVPGLSPRAARIGAVNCIRLDNAGTWYGDNVDGAGFVAGLGGEGHAVAGAHVLLVGAGGAGRALAHALCEAGAAALDLYDTRPDTVAALRAQLAACHPGVALAAAPPAAHAGHTLVINASPAGMRDADPIPIDLERAAPDAVVADLIMTPESTRLLLRAQQKGLRIHRGRHLLEASVDDMLAFFRIA